MVYIVIGYQPSSPHYIFISTSSHNFHSIISNKHIKRVPPNLESFAVGIFYIVEFTYKLCFSLVKYLHLE